MGEGVIKREGRRRKTKPLRNVELSDLAFQPDAVSCRFIVRAVVMSKTPSRGDGNDRFT